MEYMSEVSYYFDYGTVAISLNFLYRQLLRYFKHFFILD